MATVNVFGRLPAPMDARDLWHTIRGAIPQIHEELERIGKPPQPRTHQYREGPLLDQGDFPYCVGYSCRGNLDAAPIMLKPDQGPSGPIIYDVAQDNDEWPGKNYQGTSVRGGMKALQQLGQIQSYLWGQTSQDAITWIMGGHGTGVAGTNWYAEMSEVDEKGFMREPAPNLTTPIGGHAWRVVWYFDKIDAFLMRNSWGAWGMRTPTKTDANRRLGFALVRRRLFDRLLREEGEFAVPSQIRVKPVRPS